MLDNLYENIGGKIKNWAKWIFIVEAIGAIITGIVLAIEEDILYIFIAIGGPIVAWVSSWILYAFGELVENIHQIKIQNSRIYNIDKNIQLIAQPKIVDAEEKAEREAEGKAKNEVKKQAVTDAVKKYDAEKFNLQELSMGMSHDYKIAVKCGATMIRLGRILFENN